MSDVVAPTDNPKPRKRAGMVWSRLPEDLGRRLRVACAEHGRSIQSVVTEGVQLMLERLESESADQR